MELRTKLLIGLGVVAAFLFSKKASASGGGFISPAPGARITSGFGNRTDPVTGKAGTFHNGVDFGVSIATPLVAPTSGTVQFAGTLSSSPDSGIALGVKCDDGVFSWSFAHLISLGVRVGDRVEQGEIVAESGNTGKTTGPHLHFVVKRNGTAIDPRSVLPGAGGGLFSGVGGHYDVGGCCGADVVHLA